MNNQMQAGRAIRELRRKRNMTGEELGKLVGLSQSKISKVESGGRIGAMEAKKVFDVLEAPSAVRQNVLAMLDKESVTKPLNHRSLIKYDMVYDIERQTNLLRGFVAFAIPALLQSTAYRQSMFEFWGRSGSKIREILSETVKRQELLWDARRRFHFIIPESGLYAMFADHAVHIEQLNKLSVLIQASNIEFGIIPYQAGLMPVEAGTFVAYDERLVLQTIGTDELIIQDSDEIAQFLSVFSVLDKRADYGANARDLIHKAIDYFS